MIIASQSRPHVIGGLAYRYLVAIAFIIALFADVLDATIVNVALPTLGRELAVGNDVLQWVVTGYLLSLAIWIPASGWLGDRFGTKRIFLLALSIFLGGSALCGFAWNADSLIAFRVLQGIGGGMLTPVGTTMVVRAFPREERARGSAIIGVPAVLAPVLGPLIGGYLVDSVGWRWIFFVNLPIGLIGLVFAALVLREHREPRPGRFDIPGFVLAASSLGTLLYAFSRVPDAGWTSGAVIGWLATGLVAGLALIYVESRKREPMLQLRLFRDRVFATSNLAHVLTVAGLVGTLFLVPLYLQGLRGLSAWESGLTSFPQAVGLVCAMPLAGLLYPRVGARPLAVAGLLITAVSAGLLSTSDLQTTLWIVRAVLFARGLGFGLALLPLQTATFANIALSDTGGASALFNTLRQVAASLGVAALASVLSSATGVADFHAAFGASAVLGVAATGAALRLPDVGRRQQL
ncbi:MAG: multidrug efflux MFS transporter [Chloroflexi bacterium]|nr:multidrug efflux MFS transporter [Chloroflexota bacterium]